MSLPKYIEATGNICFEPPYDLLGTDFYCFPLGGKRETIQATVDQFLAPVLEGTGIRYEVISDFLMLGLAYAERASSAVEPARSTGWVPEVDWAFWVPLMRYEGNEPKRMVWFMPYVFVNNPIAMVGGREIYGFQKTTAQFDPPASPKVMGDFSLEAWAFAEFGVEQEGKVQEIFNLKNLGAGPDEASFFKDLLLAAETLVSLAEMAIGDPADLLKALIADLLRGQVPQVFLKQFRDITKGDKACYQVVAEAPARLLKLPSISPIFESYQLNNPNLASYPFAQSLGIGEGAIPLGLGMKVQMDFRMEMGEVIAQSKELRPQKVAVLGAGVGSLLAVAAVVTAPEYNGQYQFTVYERGWRIGGKGASGRNTEKDMQIEEHGLHIWLGFYNNAFHWIDAAYRAALERLGYSHLGLSWRDFFSPTDLVVFEEKVKNQWKPWPIKFPDNAEVPGSPEQFLGPIDYAEMMVEMLLEMLRNLKAEIEGERRQRTGFFGGLQDWFERLVSNQPIQALDGLLVSLLERLAQAKKAMNRAEGPVQEIEELIQAVLGEILELVDSVQKLIEKILKPFFDDSDLLRRLWTIMDLGLTVLTGMCQDKMFTRGFSVANDLDFYAWLKKHGADQLVMEGPLIQAVYDIVFGYDDGDPERPALAAGVGLYGSFRMLLTYKEHIFWRMNMGMGDIVFTPLYELLRSKGVKFEFFHQVDQIKASDDGDQIDSLEIIRQVDLKPEVKAYDPYVSVPYNVPNKDLTIDWPCWPSEPNWDQINPDQAAQLKELEKRRLTLECPWSPWEGVGRIELKRGVDFDQVICGITVRALDPISQDLQAKRPEFKEMLRQTKTVVTRGAQLWFKQSSEELGFDPGEDRYQGLEPIVGGYVEPYGSIADLTHLIAQETWGANPPKYLAYPCGVMKMGVMPPPSDQDFPMRAYQEIVDTSWAWLDQNAAYLWPNACGPDGKLKPEALDSQYWRPGVNYTEHYVLSVPGSVVYRRGPNDLKVANLFLAGDWTKNLINAGCVEAGVISGLNCARFLTGWNIPIYNATKKQLEEGP
ncbi:MAG: NAD(P)-binding protein [bacterium]|nr:NAD(P)-binding protein [bacterium]